MLDDRKLLRMVEVYMKEQVKEIQLLSDKDKIISNKNIAARCTIKTWHISIYVELCKQENY